MFLGCPWGKSLDCWVNMGLTFDSGYVSSGIQALVWVQTVYKGQQQVIKPAASKERVKEAAKFENVDSCFFLVALAKSPLFIISNFLFSSFVLYVLLLSPDKVGGILFWRCRCVRPFCPSFRPSGTISQYLLFRFDSFLVQMISTMDSQYPISLVKSTP